VRFKKAPDKELRSKVVGSIPDHDGNFQPRIVKKINKTPSVRVIVICSDHGHIIPCLTMYVDEMTIKLLQLTPAKL